MILVGQPAMIGATFDATGLRVAAQVFDSSGPVGDWIPLTNYDGTSYRSPYTYAAAGAFSVKKVVFDDADTDYTVRDDNHAELEDSVQVVDLLLLMRNAASSGAGLLIGKVGAGTVTGKIEQALELQGNIEGENEEIL